MYDVLGRRIAKAINGQPTQYLYDRTDIVQEVSEGGSVAYLRSLALDELFAVLRQDGFHFSLADGLGSTLALTDQTGSAVVQYSYDPFGRTEPTGSAFPNPFQFTGREHDGTGVYYYRARYYHPGLQRFIAEDPIDLAGGDLNLYAYVENNPVNWIDPWGLVRVPGPGALSGGVGATIGTVTGAVLGAGAGTALGEAVGMRVGFAVGGAVGLGGGPLGSLGGGIAGGYLGGKVGGLLGGLAGGLFGGKIGGLFDPPCAGVLNCAEPLPPPLGGRK
jgi:RHS repeat-associated protein